MTGRHPDRQRVPGHEFVAEKTSFLARAHEQQTRGEVRVMVVECEELHLSMDCKHETAGLTQSGLWIICEPALAKLFHKWFGVGLGQPLEGCPEGCPVIPQGKALLLWSLHCLDIDRCEKPGLLGRELEHGFGCREVPREFVDVLDP